MDCNADCGCPVSRMQPICSKDGVTNFFSPCHAGCRPPGRPNVTWDHWLKTGEDSGELPKDQYFHCSCVEAASVRDQTSLASKWLEDGAEAGRPGRVREAEEGWCEVPGCKTSMMYYMIGLAILGTVGSTGRVGNVLVALRCVEVRDKALSFGFQVSGSILQSPSQTIAAGCLLVALGPSPLAHRVRRYHRQDLLTVAKG